MSSGTGKWKTFTAKLKTVKHIELIIIIAVCTIALLVYLGISDKEEKNSDAYLPTYSGENSESDALESRLQSILSGIEGVGKCSVMIGYNDEGEAEGVVIVAQGAGDIKVKLRIIDAVCALLPISGENIKIYKAN